LRLSAIRQSWEPAIRWVFHFVSRFTRDMTLGVRGLVIDQEGKVFLIKHSYVAGWYLPGGGVERGETVRDALVRELHEEGNIELTGTPEFFDFYFNARESARDHVALFVVRDFRQTAEPVPDYEIIAHGFFAPDALPEDTTPGTRARIAEVLRGVPVAERW